MTVKTLGYSTNLYHEVGLQAGLHQAWDHHLQDHRNQDCSRYPTRKPQIEVFSYTLFHCHRGLLQSFATFVLDTTSDAVSSHFSLRPRPDLPETTATNHLYTHLRSVILITTLDRKIKAISYLGPMQISK